MAHDPPDQENPLWAYAARTIQANAAAEDVKQLALRLHREALRQYLALRLGSEAAARTALAEIGVEVGRWDVAQLTAPPGPRAHLFALARKHAAQRGTLLAPQASVVRMQHGEQAAQALSKLPVEHAEVLELRHARELSPAEIAHVLDRSVAQVEDQLAQAESAAAGALGLPDPAGVTIAAARTFALKADPELATLDGDAKPLRAGTVIGGRYTVEKAVGVGAFGQVYRASDTLVPGHTVALKLLHHAAPSEEQREAALRELRLIASVFHPSIVSFKDHGWHHDRLWFVMPWYDGESLEARMLREPLTRSEALGIFVPLANALASMHAVGVRHQDIKPENIFLAELRTDPLGEDQLQPVLLDLGVAATDAESIVAGTPAYFAPEVAATYVGQADGSTISGKADVFSLALALRNALEPDTMEEVQGTALQMFIAFRAQETPSPPASKELAFLEPRFARWLARDPDERPTAAELARELSVLIEPERKAERRTAFLSWFVPLSALFLVVLAGGGFLWSQQMRKEERRLFDATMAARNAELSAKREAELRRGLEQTHEQLQEEHEATTQKRDELAAALTETETEARQLSTRARELTRARAATMQSLEQTSAELADVNAKADELTTTKAQLEARLETSRQRIAELVEQAAGLDQVLEETRALLEREQDKAKRLEAQLDEVTAERKQARERASNLEKERNDARAELKQAEDRLSALQKELKTTEAKLDKSQKQVKRLQAKLKGGDAEAEE